MPLSLLDPTSDEHYWPPRSRGVPLGTILVAALDGVDELPDPVADKNFQPWCPTCLLLADDLIPFRWLDVLAGSRRQFGIVRLTKGKYSTPNAIRSAIRERTPPTADTLVRYIRRRTGRSGPLSALLACFEPPDLAPALADSTIARHLRDFGPYTARDWRALHRLIDATGRAPSPMERLAHALGLDPRTLRASARHFLGELAPAAARWPGWEWKLEAALRGGGYALRAAQRATPPSSMRQSGPFQVT